MPVLSVAQLICDQFILAINSPINFGPKPTYTIPTLYRSTCTALVDFAPADSRCPFLERATQIDFVNY